MLMQLFPPASYNKKKQLRTPKLPGRVMMPKFATRFHGHDQPECRVNSDIISHFMSLIFLEFPYVIMIHQGQ